MRFHLDWNSGGCLEEMKRKALLPVVRLEHRGVFDRDGHILDRWGEELVATCI
jgi:hypothetical protein